MLCSYFSYWRGSRSDLLEFLTPSSKELDDLHLSFLQAYATTYIANFFETVPLKVFGLPFHVVCVCSLSMLLCFEAFHSSIEEYQIRLTSGKLTPQVVTKESATIDGKTSIPVDADHRSIQRCESSSTGNYIKIVHQINMAVEHLNKQSRFCPR